MTHTPHSEPVGAPDGNPMIDTVPGQPPVRGTVWRTPAGDDQAPITRRLAYRLLAEYSEPGDTIVDLTGSPAVAAHAAAGDRTHVRAIFTAARTIAVTATTSPPANRRAVAWRAGGEPPEITEWFGDDLRHIDRPPGTIDDAPPPRPDRVRAPSLLIALWPLHDQQPVNSDQLTDLMSAAVLVLRPGGCVVLVASGCRDGEYSAPLAAAHAAGLRYQQHIIAVRAAVDADQFVFPSTAADLAALAAAGVGHLNIHDDIVVFATPGGGGVDD